MIAAIFSAEYTSTSGVTSPTADPFDDNAPVFVDLAETLQEEVDEEEFDKYEQRATWRDDRRRSVMPPAPRSPARQFDARARLRQYQVSRR